MPRKIKVILVDDSIVVRRILSDAIMSSDDIEVAATAADGAQALEKINQFLPDAVILDLAMPNMNGVEMLHELRKYNKSLPVIMFSSLTRDGARETFDALSAGANDCVAKPANMGNFQESVRCIKNDLLPKIRKYSQIFRGLSEKQFVSPGAAVEKRHISLRKIEVVAIGSSTGGPEALARVIGELSGGIGVPILIVQHMPPFFTKLLAERLAVRTKLGVIEAADGMKIEPDRIYIAPGDNHMFVKRNKEDILIGLNQGEPENYCRPSVDVLFRSVAENFRNSSLAVILTGMGSDGTKGCRAIRDSGGMVIVQDRETSVVPSMPGSVMTAGLADGVFPIGKIGQEILRKIRESAEKTEKR